MNEKERLEYIRCELRAERGGNLFWELESLVEFIEDGDVELLEPAGVPKGMTGPEWKMILMLREVRGLEPYEVADKMDMIDGFVAKGMVYFDKEDGVYRYDEAYRLAQYHLA